MKTRYTIWKGLLAFAVLMALVTTAFAVSEADVVRLKNKVANGEQLTEAEVAMAIKAEGLFGSQIIQPEPQQFEAPRLPHNTLDEYQFAVVDYEWIDVLPNAQATGLANDDHNLGPFDIGFSFPFFDQTYTQFRVCTNGWISFTSTSTAYTNGTIPSTVEPNNAIYPFWDDMYLPFTPDDPDSIYYFSDVANQRLVVTWDSVSHIGAVAEKYTYQIVLTPDGNIRLNYRYVTETGVYGNTTCTVGIENAAGTEALQICANAVGTLPVSEMSILISQPDGVPVAPTGLTVANTAGGVALTWINPTLDTNGNPVTPDHVEVWRGATQAQELIATLPGGTTSYTDVAPTDVNRTYVVRACSPVFCGAGAAGPVPTPLAPANVVGVPGANNVMITWDDPTQNSQGGPVTVTGVEIWMGPAGTGTLLGTVAGGVETYNATGLASGNYTFSVRALSYVFTSPSAGLGAVVGNPSYFSDFEADDGDFIASAGWSWGTPTNAAGPTAAHSGVNCWGTGMAVNYDNNACYYLDIDQELTVGSDAATLEFFMWQSCENFWDGLNIKVSTDEGATWTIVTAVDTPYFEDLMNGNATCHADEPAWSGNRATLGWRYYVVSLADFVGMTPIIRFSFGSDPSVTYPGFFIDDVVLWGFGEPEFAAVSGTVTLDGGAGAVTAVSVSSNGIGNPVTNPAANGTYTLPQVLVGNRRISASLNGYHPVQQDIVLASGGMTGVNLTLTRVDPPVPTGLVGTVANATGIVTLNWDNSTDALVDVYPVYRRLQGDTDWVLQGSPATSDYTQTLPAAGIYQYAVSARDNNVSTPVESELTDPITVLFGALPPSGLSANGNYDDRIVLSWFEPGTPPEFELSYDDGTNEVQGIAWWAGAPTFGWMVAKFQTTSGTAQVTRIKPFWSADAQVPFDVDVEVAVFEDAGDVPTFEPLGVTSFLKANPGDFQDVELDNPVSVGSTFWVGVRQIGANPLGLGGDNDTPFINSTFKYNFDGTVWTAFEPGLLSIPMLRCFAVGQFGGLMELSPAPIEVSESSLSPRAVETKSKDGVSTTVVFNENHLTASTTQPNLRDLIARGANAVAPHVPRIAARTEGGRDRNRSLDEVDYYIVYRDNVDIAHPVVETYTDLGRVENTVYRYTVAAHYDDNQVSERDTVDARCNMAPAAPTGLVVNALGTTQMALAWVAPASNADATPLVDLAGYQVFRDGTQIGTTAAGVTTYTDTPPDNQTFYTWTVAAVDEVPNVSAPSASAIGAVVSPWEVYDYEWVDISGVGTPADITSDDDNSGPFDLGFNVTFYGETYSSVYMCSNGWASFTSTSTAYSNVTIPNAAEPNTALYCFWDDMYPPDGGQYLYYQDTANDRFILSWIDVPHIGNDLARYTYQIIITADGGIIYNYNTIATETPGITSATIGVENSTGTEAIEVFLNGTGAFTPANETSVAFWAGPSGAVTGLVREFGTNLPIANAEVWVTEINEFTLTDAAGNFSMSVEPGTYTLLAHKQGYCDIETANVVVDDGGTTTRNFSMRQPNATFSATSLNIFAQIGQDGAASLEITNPGATCEVSYEITTDQTWLTVTPATGDVAENESQMITVNADVSGFSVGDYDATILVDHNDTGSPYEIPVTVTVSVSAGDNVELPTVFALHANYPNPFNATTSLNFDVPNESRVQITIFNVQGQEVARPVDSVLPAGNHRVIYSASDLPTGMYLVKMSAADFTAVQKMILLK